MKTKQSVILLLALLAFSLPAADSTNRLHFPLSGFSIAALEAPPGEAPRQALVMFLPEHANFSGNVNVQIQPYAGTIDEYLTLTEKQFKDAGINVIEQRRAGKAGLLLEYSGELQGQSLHWYARAEKSGDHVYLATSSAAEKDWAKQAAQLKACVDSFRCEGSEQVAVTNASAPHREGQR